MAGGLSWQRPLLLPDGLVVFFVELTVAFVKLAAGDAALLELLLQRQEPLVVLLLQRDDVGVVLLLTTGDVFAAAILVAAPFFVTPLFLPSPVLLAALILEAVGSWIVRRADARQDRLAKRLAIVLGGGGACRSEQGSGE